MIKLKDFFGNPIHRGDTVLTFQNLAGQSSHFVTAKVERITEKRVYLETQKGLYLIWTVPNKCVVLSDYGVQE